MRSSKYLSWLRRKIGYFGDESNLHGVRYVCSLRTLLLFGRFFWSLILICSAIGVFFILDESLSVYGDNIVSYSVETTYLQWKTVFPSVSICESFDSERRSIYFAEKHIHKNFSRFYEDVNFLNPNLLCRSCEKCTVNVSCLEDLDDLSRNYRAPCKEIFSECSWQGETFSCCDRFLPVNTEFGVCYIFNSNLATNDTHLFRNTIQSGPGRLTFVTMESVFINIHSTDDVTIVQTGNTLGSKENLPFVTDFHAIVKVEDTVNDPEVLKVPIEVRGCRFWWEFPSWYKIYPRYSYSGCLLQCKANVQANRCNCTHHLMPRIDGVPKCGLKGIQCLSRDKESYSDLPDCTRKCLPTCEETLYKIVYVLNRQYEKLTAELIERGSVGIVELADLPNLRVRRQILRNLLGLTVDIGGVAGVFFGASILSLIEIFYLFYKGR